MVIIYHMIDTRSAEIFCDKWVVLKRTGWREDPWIQEECCTENDSNNYYLNF